MSGKSEQLYFQPVKVYRLHKITLLEMGVGKFLKIINMLFENYRTGKIQFSAYLPYRFVPVRHGISRLFRNFKNAIRDRLIILSYSSPNLHSFNRLRTR